MNTKRRVLLIVTAGMAAIDNRILGDIGPFSTGTVVAFVGAIVLIITAKRTKADTVSLSLKMFVLFVLWAAVTTIWAPDRELALTKLGHWILFALFYYSLDQEAKERTARGDLFGALFLSGVAALCAGGVQLALDGVGGRLDGFTGNPNTFGTFLITGAVGASALLGNPMQRKARMLVSAYLIVIAPLLVMSASRGSVVAYLILVLWFGMARRPGLLVLILGTALLLIVAVPFVADELIGRFGDRDEMGGRYAIWEASILLSRAELWTGVGVGNSGAVLGEYLYGPFTEVSVSTHNPLLRQLLETGALGLLLYMASVGGPVVRYAVWRGRNAVRDPLIAGLVMYFLVWMKNGGADYNKSLFVLLAGVSAALQNNRGLFRRSEADVY